MSKNKAAARLKLADEMERLAADHSLEVELNDGSTITIPPPELWPDESREVYVDPTKDDRDFGRAILGNEAWERFVANGGTGPLMAHLITQRYQMTLGESSASSTS